MSNVREEIGWIAEEIQSTAVQAREASSRIVKHMEELFRNESRYDLSTDAMDERYVWKESSYMWTPNEGKTVNAVVGASGAVPTDETVKRELMLYEHVLPLTRELYEKNRYSDEVLYIDKRSLVVGHTTTNFGATFPPGFDALAVCRMGVTYYDYYGWVDCELNPERVARWAPSAFIELLGEFIQAVHAPVYRNENDAEMIGFVGLHYNLEWLNAATVYKSSNRVLTLSSQSTLIGASAGALEVLGMEPYKRQAPSYLAAQEVRRYVDVERNLEQEKPDDVAEMARKIKSEPEFDHTINGRHFKVIREYAPELGFYVAALL